MPTICPAISLVFHPSFTRASTPLLLGRSCLPLSSKISLLITGMRASALCRLSEYPAGICRASSLRTCTAAPKHPCPRSLVVPSRPFPGLSGLPFSAPFLPGGTPRQTRLEFHPPPFDILTVYNVTTGSFFRTETVLT